MVKTVLFLRVTVDGSESAHVTQEIDVKNNEESVAAIKALVKALHSIAGE